PAAAPRHPGGGGPHHLFPVHGGIELRARRRDPHQRRPARLSREYWGSMPMADVVLYESAEQIATIIINRPDKRNAINGEVAEALRQAWLRFNASDDRVAILTGAGDRAFSVGADLGDAPEFWRCTPGVAVPVEKPVIAALSGWCIGGAVCLVTFADLCVAA